MEAVVDAIAAVAAAVAGAVAWANAGLGGKLAEWATAVATSLAAIGTFIGLRRTRAQVRQVEDPVAEVRMQRAGRVVSISLTLENRTGRSLIIRRVEVLRPRGGRVSDVVPQQSPSDSYWRFERASMDVEWTIGGAGAPSDNPLHSGRGDRVHRWFAVEGPAGWAGGKVAVALTAEESSATSRSRRIVIRRTL